MDKATLDEGNFRYNHPDAHKPHKYVKETNPLDWREPNVCRVCGRPEDKDVHNATST